MFPYGLLSAGDVHDEVTETGAVKRVGSVDLGTLAWRTDSYIGFERFYSNTIPSSSVWNNCMCSKYSLPSTDAGVSQEDKTIKIFNQRLVCLRDTSLSASDIGSDGKIAKLNGVILYYELATPIIITIDSPQQLGYNVQSGGTEKLLPTNPSSVNPVTAPIILSVVYPLDAVGTLTNLPKNYISVESMDSFTTALGNFINANISKSWDATNNKWNFTVTSR